MIAKRLIMEGTKVWNSIAQNNHAVHWETVVFEIEEQFMKIACCSSRSLMEQVSFIIFFNHSCEHTQTCCFFLLFSDSFNGWSSRIALMCEAYH